MKAKLPISALPIVAILIMGGTEVYAGNIQAVPSATGMFSYDYYSVGGVSYLRPFFFIDYRAGTPITAPCTGYGTTLRIYVVGPAHTPTAAPTAVSAFQLAQFEKMYTTALSAVAIGKPLDVGFTCNPSASAYIPINYPLVFSGAGSGSHWVTLVR